MRRLTRLPAAIAILGVVVALGGSPPSAGAAGAPLRYLGGEPGTLDPAFIADAGDVQFLLQVYAGLTRLDENGEPYPSLAEGWTVSDDARTYTFRLREGLTFSDGEPLDASDVRRSWLRLLDPATGATAPDVLSVIRGAAERLAGTAGEEGVGISVPDPRTLVVELRHPAGYFPSLVATPATFVVPRSADAGEAWQTLDDFVGSGPYVVDGTDGPDLVLRANDRYVAGPPPIDEVRFLGGIEGDGVGAFVDGQVDLVGVAGFDASWLRYDQELGRSLHAAASLGVQYFGFDTTRPPFDDARVRRAFALALDRGRLVELAEGPNARAASSVVPPALWPSGMAEIAAADPDEARDLLADAGYADPADLGAITVNGTGLGVGPAVETWRSTLGVDIAVETMAFGEYIRRLDTEAPQVFTINWIADYPSPHALYGLLLLPDAQSNYGRWTDTTFAELLEAAAQETDAARRDAAYLAVDARVVSQAPIIPWAYGETWWLVRDGLRGLGNLTVGLMDFGRVSWDG